MNLIRAYHRLLDTHPWSSQMLTTGIMMGSGDAISQLIVEHRSYHNFDRNRSLRFFAIGTLFTGPLIWKWFTFLERVLPGKRKFSTAFKRMLLDQVIFSPISYTLFLAILGALQGQDYNGIRDKWRKEFWIVYKRNLEVWPAVQFANFYFIPLSYRIFVTKIVGIFWNTYLSWQTNRPEQSENIPSQF